MAKRRGNNEGSWRKKNNRWEYRVSFGRSLSGEIIRKSFYGKTKQECIESFREYETSQHSNIIASDIAFKAWAERYLAAIASKPIKNKSMGEYIIYIKKHAFSTPLLDMPLRNIKPIHAEEFMAQFSKMSSSFRGKLARIMRGVFDSAIENELIINNPFRNIKIKQRIKKATHDNTFSIAECIKIRDFCKNSNCKMRLATQIFLYTGMRRGELLGLQWTDIDFENKTISIRRAVCTTHTGTKQLDNFTKTDAGMRKIPLLPQLECILREEKRKSIFIMPTKSNDYYNPAGFQKTYNDFIAKIEGVRPLGTHAFRHAIASHLKNAGVASDDIAAIIGHKDSHMTDMVYILYDESRAPLAMQKVPY